MAERQYVYAIVARDTALPPDLTGTMAERLSLVESGDLAAVTGKIDGPLNPEVAHVLRHEATVEAIREGSPALPVRFGTILPNIASVRAALNRRHGALIADLARLGDKIEFGLTVLWNLSDDETDNHSRRPEQPREFEGSGSAYLRARVDEVRREDARRAKALALAEELDAALGVHTVERRRQLIPTERLAVRAAYLLEPAKAPAFKDAFEDVRVGHPTIRFLLSGPWPPYTFVSRESVESVLATPAAAEKPEDALDAGRG